jgi:hypothetical protein
MFEALCGDKLAASALDQSSQHIIQHIHAISGTLKLS